MLPRQTGFLADCRTTQHHRQQASPNAFRAEAFHIRRLPDHRVASIHGGDAACGGVFRPARIRRRRRLAAPPSAALERPPGISFDIAKPQYSRSHGDIPYGGPPLWQGIPGNDGGVVQSGPVRRGPPAAFVAGIRAPLHGQCGSAAPPMARTSPRAATPIPRAAPGRNHGGPALVPWRCEPVRLRKRVRHRRSARRWFALDHPTKSWWADARPLALRTGAPPETCAGLPICTAVVRSGPPYEIMVGLFVRSIWSRRESPRHISLRRRAAWAGRRPRRSCAARGSPYWPLPRPR